MPVDIGSKMFLHKYQCFRQDKNQQVLFDHQVMADIDELSDTEKVSLISDMELRAGVRSSSPVGASEQIQSKEAAGGKRSRSQKKQRGLFTDSNQDSSLLVDQSLNLKNLKDLTKENQPFAAKVHNGIKITKQKYLCRHRRRCSSCFRLPVDPETLNIANHEVLIENLRAISQRLPKERKGLRDDEDYVATTAPAELHKQNFLRLQ